MVNTTKAQAPEFHRPLDWHDVHQGGSFFPLCLLAATDGIIEQCCKAEWQTDVFFFHLSFQLDGIFVARSALNDHMIVSVSSKQTRTSEIPSSSEDLFKSSFLWKEDHSMRS